MPVSSGPATHARSTLPSPHSLDATALHLAATTTALPHAMPQNFWPSIQNLIRSQVDERTWEQFFRHLAMRHVDDTSVVFELPDTFFVTWFENHYMGYLSDVIREVTGHDLDITLDVRAPLPPGAAADLPPLVPAAPAPSNARVRRASARAPHDPSGPLGGSRAPSFQTMKTFWHKIQTLIRSQVDERTWEQFFRHLAMHDYDEQRLIFELPDTFFVTWFENHYMSYLSDVIREVTGQSFTIGLVARESNPTPQANPTAAAASSVTPPPYPDAVPAHFTQGPNSNDGGTRWPYPHAVASGAEHDADRATLDFIPPSIDELIVRAGLNPRYTFDQFIVGPSNQFPHAACQAIAERPAQSYNPMFLYGGVGLGKTHLLHAVGIELLRRKPQWRVAYISAENFMNALIDALKTRDTNAFRSKYRDQCDLLLVDDIQFIAGKNSTQEEFFHTFNALYQARKQIVITSDKPPQDLPGLEERLRSRFGWGLISDIQPPEIETRVAIIQTKAEAEHIDLSDDVAMFLASHIRSNVRELEGALIRLKAYAALYKSPITIDLARKQLKDVIAETLQTLTIETIQSRVAVFFGIKVKDLVGPRRRRVISHPRHVAMYLCRQHTDHSYVEIGKAFGGRDHTTVINAVNKLTKRLREDDDFAAEMRAIEQAILS